MPTTRFIQIHSLYGYPPPALWAVDNRDRHGCEKEPEEADHGSDAKEKIAGGKTGNADQ